MAERLSGASGAPSQGKEILGPPEIARSLFRIAHEILERNRGTQDVVDEDDDLAVNAALGDLRGTGNADGMAS